MTAKYFTFQSVNLSVINQQKANKFLSNIELMKPAYICFPDSYTVFNATKDSKLTHILNNALLNMPDGKPLELYARRKGLKGVGTVSGFWLCKALLANKKNSHYFYGSSPAGIKNLEFALREEFPEANILGFKSPPFIPLAEVEKDNQIQAEIDEISSLKPDYLWIGISSPKQDYLMAHYFKNFDKTLLLGIGGVFEYLSGDIRKSPEWIKKIGLRWLYRLIKEPRRLWRKYWFVIKGFILVLLHKA